MKTKMKSFFLSVRLFSVITFFIFLTVILFTGSKNLYISSDTDQSPSSIKIPEGNGKPVLIDGIFTGGEWNDAMKIEINRDVDLFFKKNSGHIFIGVEFQKFNYQFVDMFISPGKNRIYQFHSSAQISEKIVDIASPEDTSPFSWGFSKDWYANEIRWNYAMRDSLLKAGVDQSEAISRSSYEYDGFEFQIRQSKFKSDEWLFRIEIPCPPDFENPVVFPSNADKKDTANWTKLILN